MREKAGKVILTYLSDDEKDDEWSQGEGLLSSMISVRTELARGDLRALYLGWLLRVQAGELDDEDIEPPVPPGLGQPSASLEMAWPRSYGLTATCCTSPLRPVGRLEKRIWIGTRFERGSTSS